jgi:hypothetical protein
LGRQAWLSLNNQTDSIIGNAGGVGIAPRQPLIKKGPTNGWGRGCDEAQVASVRMIYLRLIVTGLRRECKSQKLRQALQLRDNSRSPLRRRSELLAEG